MDTPSELNEVVLPQPVVGPLTRASIFLVVCIRQDEEAYSELRAFCADLSGLIRAVEFRDIEAGLTCIAVAGAIYLLMRDRPRTLGLPTVADWRNDHWGEARVSAPTA